MIVYIVEKSIPYEGSEIFGVYKTKAAAEKAIEKAKEEEYKVSQFNYYEFYWSAFKVE